MLLLIERVPPGSSRCGTAEMNLDSIHEDAVLIPGLAQCVRDPVLLRSRFAVDEAQVSSYSFHLTPTLGTSICCGCSPKKQKKKKKKKKKKESLWLNSAGSVLAFPKSSLSRLVMDNNNLQGFFFVGLFVFGILPLFRTTPTI